MMMWRSTCHTGHEIIGAKMDAEKQRLSQGIAGKGWKETGLKKEVYCIFFQSERQQMAQYASLGETSKWVYCT